MMRPDADIIRSDELVCLMLFLNHMLTLAIEIENFLKTHTNNKVNKTKVSHHQQNPFQHPLHNTQSFKGFLI